MKVLIIHHLETMWESGLRNNGTSFEEQIELIFEHLKEEEYDKVILTRFEDWTLEPEHYLIANFISVVHPYAYGWERDSFEGQKEGVDWVEGGYHSDAVLLEDWMKELKGNEVEICGAFDGECIEDLEIALSACKVEYNRINRLIV